MHSSNPLHFLSEHKGKLSSQHPLQWEWEQGIGFRPMWCGQKSCTPSVCGHKTLCGLHSCLSLMHLEVQDSSTAAPWDKKASIPVLSHWGKPYRELLPLHWTVEAEKHTFIMYPPEMWDGGSYIFFNLDCYKYFLVEKVVSRPLVSGQTNGNSNGTLSFSFLLNPIPNSPPLAPWFS